MEQCVRAKAVIDHVDAFLLEQQSLINKKSRRLIPIVSERTRLSEHFVKLLVQLGLDRVAKPIQSLNEIMAEVEMNILQTMASPKLFAPWFKRKLLRGDTWAAWRVFLKALFALELEPDELSTFTAHTGRSDVPTEQSREAWLVCGRRSGKSLIAAFIAVYVACFRKYDDYLSPGEVGTMMVIASDKRQARVVLGYINGFFDAVNTLNQMVVHRTKESITLNNRIRNRSSRCFIPRNSRLHSRWRNP